MEYRLMHLAPVAAGSILPANGWDLLVLYKQRAWTRAGPVHNLGGQCLSSPLIESLWAQAGDGHSVTYPEATACTLRWEMGIWAPAVRLKHMPRSKNLGTK